MSKLFKSNIITSSWNRKNCCIFANNTQILHVKAQYYNHRILLLSLYVVKSDMEEAYFVSICAGNILCSITVHSTFKLEILKSKCPLYMQYNIHER